MHGDAVQRETFPAADWHQEIGETLFGVAHFDQGRQLDLVRVVEGRYGKVRQTRDALFQLRGALGVTARDVRRLGGAHVLVTFGAVVLVGRSFGRIQSLSFDAIELRRQAINQGLEQYALVEGGHGVSRLVGVTWQKGSAEGRLPLFPMQSVTNAKKPQTEVRAHGAEPATETRTDAVEWAAHIAKELGLSERGAAAVLRLSAEGATVPFLARYRKEATGGLDEVQIRAIVERAEYLTELAARRRVIVASITEQGKLTPELSLALAQATTKSELEDLYLPFKPKRKTRASVAKERGLEPLATALWAGEVPASATASWLTERAKSFVNPGKEVPGVEEALAGARDICAERLSEVVVVRQKARELVRTQGVLSTTKAKAHREAVTKFDTYAQFSEPLKRLAGYRLLAIERGKAEGVLKAKMDVDTVSYQRWAVSQIPASKRQVPAPVRQELERVVADATERLVVPSAESDVESELLERAHAEAIAVFASNLRQLLLAAPLGGKRVLGIDPGQRTGCKCVVLTETGKLVEHTVVHLVAGPTKLDEAKRVLAGLVKRHRIEAIAVGNGTHGRETERFVRDVLKDDPTSNPAPAFVVSVNEAGASVYSASDVAREEFPDHDVTVRGAVSIGRRLQDPLAELVKIEPKSIGVGQYQHDVNQKQLSQKLTDVVETCVNEVGVELNTASAELLSYVSGVGKKLARSIVAQRDHKGPFKSRRELLEVKGLGPKAFEQCAGFLRIREGEHPLDASAVHPERYALVERMAKDAGRKLSDLVGNPSLVAAIPKAKYESDDVGEFTLNDILSELAKPGRDPRAHFAPPQFDDSITKLEDLKQGMVLEGVVTNVTAFGAFVDVGVHQDGLVHVSQLANHFVKDPTTVVSVGDKLRVKVLEVDLPRKRVSLSARDVK